ncbi:molecular chaperone DnaJ [Syntrophotalea acetylenivorans]|uniref:Molecular chaperone DnaJ n=2 Tax=Syntrophotalea acetylenivorans TaxID=1842532 RepID=A0A1L3GS58_9BACT|nr:J domain-containing protein [Syntrophotalea acetylenivorans]APG28784.1 molecular chaperone DnaJ [Syntrophotalea acetylenivorans]
MDFSELHEAQQLLELGDRASLKEIKERYRELARRHHPDAGGEQSARMQEINAAYALLLAYLKDYRFSFAEEEFYEQQPEERLRQQFGDDPLWGNK